MQTYATPIYRKPKGSSAINTTRQTSFFSTVKVQPKLSIGAVDDPYEREADAMADRVLRMPAQQNASPNFTDNKTSFFSSKPISTINVQRECAICEKEKLKRKEEKPEEEKNVIHRKEKSFDGGLNNIDNTVQRKCAECEKEEKLQMKSESGASAGMEASSIVYDVINSGGQPLDTGTRSFFEPRFGHDFSNVKIHTGSKAAESSRAINAHAYTTGNNIVFNEGKFSPNTEDGKRLLGHELTHVVQQNNAISRQVIQRYPWPYALHYNKEVNENVSETISNAPAGSEAWNGTYNWDSLFRIELNAMFGEVWMIVRLSSTAPLAVRKSWERAIERKWSNRMYLRVTIPGSKEGPCKFLIKADIRWVTDPAKAHHTITPKNPGDTCNGRAGVNDTCSMTDWGTRDTSDITHEFGHILGNPEEYFTTNGHNFATGGKAGFRDPGGGIMNNPAERVHRKHFNLLREHVAKMLHLSTSNVRVIYNNEAIPDCAADIGDFPEKSIPKENASA